VRIIAEGGALQNRVVAEPVEKNVLTCFQEENGGVIGKL